MPNKKFFFIIASVGIYLLVTGISFAVFTAISQAKGGFTSPLTEVGSTTDNVNRRALVEVAGSKNEACPLNGAKYTKVEKNIWETHRPLAVMIENHQEARPQSGLSDADIVYEAVAEGGITRFMAVYLCQAAAFESILGPVRSARTYFLDWASEYNFPLYAHVGGANTPGPANALGQINSYDWAGANDLNQFSIGYPTFWRDYERLGHTVATEHTMYSTTSKLWAVAEKRGWTNLDPEESDWFKGFTSWKFAKEAAKLDDRAANQTISYSFWDDAEYGVKWEYDRENNLYKRFNGGQPHTDLNVNQQLTTTNLVVQFSVERNANDGYPGNIHLLYSTIGQGKALVFLDGKATEATWSKAKRTSRTIFYAAQGKEITFNPGRVWISVLPVGNQVDY